MKKVLFSLFLMTFFSVGYSNSAIDSAKSFLHSQYYCAKKQPKASIEYLKSTSNYAYEVCLGEALQDREGKKDLRSLEKLYQKDPAKYGLYLGIANYVSTDRKNVSDNVESEKILQPIKKSADAGNQDAKVMYCTFKGAFANDNKLIKSCLTEVGTAEAYYSMAVAAVVFSEWANACLYIQKAYDGGYAEALPFDLECKIQNNNYQLTDKDKEQLKAMVANKDAEVSSKYLSAYLLGDKKTQSLLLPFLV